MSSKVRLNNWSIVTNASPYDAPETVKVKLNGDVEGHPAFKDGENVTTSSIQDINPETREVKTRNTVYKLGPINPDYEAAFPNAEARFFANTP